MKTSGAIAIFGVMNNSNFLATYKLLGPAGEEIPVMLVSKPKNFRYRVISEAEYEDQGISMYEWHPSEGVTYRGCPLPGLEILPLEERGSSRTPSWARLLAMFLSRLRSPLLRRSLLNARPKELEGADIWL